MTLAPLRHVRLIRAQLEEIVDVRKHIPRGDVSGVEGGELWVLQVRDAGGEALQDDAAVGAFDAVAGHDGGVGDGGGGGEEGVGDVGAEGVAEEDDGRGGGGEEGVFFEGGAKSGGEGGEDGGLDVQLGSEA